MWNFKKQNTLKIYLNWSKGPNGLGEAFDTTGRADRARPKNSAGAHL